MKCAGVRRVASTTWQPARVVVLAVRRHGLALRKAARVSAAAHALAHKKRCNIAATGIY